MQPSTSEPAPPPSPSPAPPSPVPAGAVALLSGAILALELAWTRVLAAEFFHSFAFLVLSLAILGIGLGALALRLSPRLGGPSVPAAALAAAAVAALAAPPAVLRLGLDFQRLVEDAWLGPKLAAAIVLLGAPFALAGLALARFLRDAGARVHRLYAADLAGAAAGVILVLAAMQALGVPAAAVLAAVPLFVAAAWSARGALRAACGLLAAGALALLPAAPALLRSGKPERAPVIYEHWDALAKLKVLAFDADYHGVVIDDVANSPIPHFDGNFADPELVNADFGVNVGWLVRSFGGSCRFLSLGAGGGGDVLQALAHGAAEVHAVEVNPWINRMLREGDPVGYLATPRLPPPRDGKVVEAPSYRHPDGRPITEAEFSGHLYRDPRVRVVSEDARTYVRRHRGAFDLIFSLSSNTWAALGSGAFAFAESYLFTREAFEDDWDALAPEGFLVMEHQVYAPRLVPAVLEALAARGVAEPAAHLAVYELPKLRRNVLLVSRRPLTDEVRARALGPLGPETADRLRLLWPVPAGAEPGLVARLVTEGWRAVAPGAPVNVSPPTDDRPFVAQMGRLRNLDWKALGKRPELAEFRGWPLSQSILLAILAVVAVLVLPLTLLPALGRGPRLGARVWLYFFAIGAAFMFVEVVLIQRWALFLGASIWSVATVLVVLLAASGLGSRLAPGFGDRLPFAAIAALAVAHALLAPPLMAALAWLPLWARVAVTAAAVAPLGVAMGVPFPKGAARAGPAVDWGLAVNGVASVVGGTAVVLVAFAWGFGVALVIAAGLYLGAAALLPAREA